MAAYVDPCDFQRGSHRSGHLIADSLEELHALAAAIDISKQWFQKDAPVPHYTLLEFKREEALKFGAIALDRAAFTRKAEQVGRRLSEPSKPGRGRPVRPAQRKAPSSPDTQTALFA